MRIKKWFILLLSMAFLGCEKSEDMASFPGIIPKPIKQEFHEGFFRLNNETTFYAEAEFSSEIAFLNDKLLRPVGIQLKKEISKEQSDIRLELDASIPFEGYNLTIDNQHIVLKASSNEGIFYGLQSIRQLLPVCIEDASCNTDEFEIKNSKIQDAPRFPYRGMHLDVSRHFFAIDEVKKYIDALAMLKMNTFHWHLTDDQGWRIEIKKYPELTSYGSIRKETLVGHYNDQPHQFDGESYGGFYTQEQIKEIVLYANKRKITIIPEIEMPGHAQAAIATYPKLGCEIEKAEVATKWGIFPEVFCPRESTFEFLENVLSEVIALFPSKYIHIGGDEAPKTHWKNCRDCQKLMKKEGLHNENELQSYFIKRIEKFVNSKGKHIIGWDEILEGGLAPNATVMSWRGVKGAIQAAKEKHQVIMTPTSHCYFDYYQSDDEAEPLAIGGYLPLKKVYDFEPVPSQLTKDEEAYIIGAQGNVWTEYMKDYEKVEYMAFPRAIALSEVVWTRQDKKNYLDFVGRLEHFQKRLDKLAINYANHLYKVEGSLQKENNGLVYLLSTLTREKEIRFTTDGSEPSKNSKIYTTPIFVDDDKTIKAAVFKGEEKLGSVFSQSLHVHKAVGKEIQLNVDPHKAYSGSGKMGLINGINGSNARFGDKEWLGFWGEDLEIKIDLGKMTSVNEISTRFYNANGQWIYAPKSVEVYFSEDGKDFGLQESKVVEIDQASVVPVHFLVATRSTRFIKLKIDKYGLIPDGLQGAGNQAWTFIDEIIVN